MTDRPLSPRPENDPELPPGSGVGEGARHAPFPVERAVAALAMATICAISAANVVVRYATNASFAFTEEYSVLLLVVLTFAGTAAAAATDSHIRILAFTNLFPLPVRRAMLIASTIATLAMFVLVAWYGLRLTLDEYTFGDRTAGLGNPAWMYSAVMPALCLPVMIRVVIAAIGNWRKGRA